MWWVFVVASLATSGSSIQVAGSAGVSAALATLSTLPGVSNATVASFLSSPSVNATFTAIQDIPTLEYLIIYHIFGLLWTGSFIIGCASMSVAGAVAAWYFSRVPAHSATGVTRRSCNPLAGCCGAVGELPPEGLRPATFYPLERWPVCASLGRVVKYYLGTIACGAFLIALLSFLRSLLAYLYKRLRAGGATSQWLKFLCCCLQCCMWCLQKVVELVSRNAFIYTAVKGTSFCESTGAVFALIVANAGTVAAVNVLAELILFLGKVLVAAASTWICYAVIDNYKAFQPGGASELSSTWLVILVCFFFAYLTASAFMLVFDLSIDTVLVCYIIDRSENGGVAAHTDARKFDELERVALAEAASHAVGHKGVSGGGGGGGGGGGSAQVVEPPGLPPGSAIGGALPTYPPPDPTSFNYTNSMPSTRTLQRNVAAASGNRGAVTGAPGDYA